jgi:ketosteroid isomerase-like protein
MTMNRRKLARERGITMGTTVRTDEKVKVYGDTAIYSCSFKRVDKDKEGKEATLEGRNTQTWVKLQGKWKLAASHSSPKVEMPK